LVLESVGVIGGKGGCLGDIFRQSFSENYLSDSEKFPKLNL